MGYFVSKLKEFKLLVCWDLQTEGLIIIITGKNNTIIRELHEWHVRRKRVFFVCFFMFFHLVLAPRWTDT